jgi:hypothetical protein
MTEELLKTLNANYSEKLKNTGEDNAGDCGGSDTQLDTGASGDDKRIQQTLYKMLSILNQ